MKDGALRGQGLNLVVGEAGAHGRAVGGKPPHNAPGGPQRVGDRNAALHQHTAPRPCLWMTCPSALYSSQGIDGILAGAAYDDDRGDNRYACDDTEKDNPHSPPPPRPPPASQVGSAGLPSL